MAASAPALGYPQPVTCRAIVVFCIGFAIAALGCSDADEGRRFEQCAEVGETLPNPTTIEEAVDRLNALPSPVTIPCAIASLQRPFDLVAARSFLSAQPSEGDASPRMFLLLNASLVLSVVPAGRGAALLEFGEFVGPLHTVKGELDLPADTPIASSLPFEHVLYDQGNPPTTCGFCHGEEKEQRVVGGVSAFESVAFRPHDDLLLSVERVRLEHLRCDRALTPERCEMFEAVFDYGFVGAGMFSDDLARHGDPF